MENTREILVAIIPEPSDYPNPLPPLGFSGDVSVNPLTAAAQIEAALTQVNQQLTEFVASANFQGDLQTAFGASTDVELGATIIEALSQGETPNLKVLSAASMNGADGAFDSVTGTVYLSEGVIHSEKLVDVITEEFGHYIDSQLNEIDSPGDEGELFMRLVNGEALSEADITGLRNQDDWGLIWVEGEPVAVQMAHNTMRDALNMGVITSQGRVISDRIGFREEGVLNSQDFYKFSISEDSEVNLTLDQLRANANVEILDGDGSTVIFRSTEPGRRPEEITENLGAGDYYIRVFPNGRSDRTSYRLGVSAEALAMGEGKDTIATAQNLGNIGPEGVSEVDRIGFGRGKSRDTQDFFKFSIAENSEFLLTLDDLRANANVQLLDADGETILEQSTNPGRQAEKISTDLEAGDYVVRVFPVGNARTPYRLGMSANPSIIEDDDSKPGITLGPVTEANPVNQTGNVGSGTGRRRDTQDWYNFTLPVDSDVNLTLDRLRANLNVDIYDEDGELVERGTNPGSQAEKIELEGLEAGTYYVKVTPVGNARSNYRLGITAAIAEIDDYATPEEALDFGKVVPGDDIPSIRNSVGFTVGSSGRDERDWVRFELTKDGFVDINLTGLSQNIDMRLYDGDGKTVLQTADKKGPANENISDFLDAGVYYVQVFPNGNARSEYRLSINSDINPPLQEFSVGDLFSLRDNMYTNSDRIGFAESGIRNTTDRYEFTLESEAEVDISLTGLRGNADIQLKETNGSLLFDSTNPGNQAEQISQELRAGTYYLDVVPVGNARTVYNLDIMAITDSVDPDGGPVPGSSLFNDLGVLTEDYSKIDRVGFGTGSRRDQVDYYGFRLNEAKSLAIGLENLSDNINLELLDSSGSVMFESRNPGTRDEKIEQDLDPGTYYVAVRPQGSARGEYTLKIIDEDLPKINIADTRLKEGDRDRTNARFVVTLDNPSSERVVVDYATADGTATVRDRDYQSTAGRLIFQPGQTRQFINVPVFGDTKVEPDETFTVNLSNPQNAELGRRRATGTILNDDVPGNNNPQPKPPNDDIFSSAENLGRLTGEIVRTDEIGFASGGDRNTEDYYRFHLNREGTVQVVLDDLFQNANLQFLGSTGDIINQSRNPGIQREIITQRKLEPGTYYVRVFPHLAARTPYRLSINLI